MVSEEPRKHKFSGSKLSPHFSSVQSIIGNDVEFTEFFGSKEISFPSFVTFVKVGDFSFCTCPRVNGGLARNTNNKIEIKKLRRESILTF